jgi:hypothetical protein
MKKLLAQVLFILIILYMLPLIVVAVPIVFFLRILLGMDRIAIDGKGKYVFKEDQQVSLPVAELGSITFNKPNVKWLTITPNATGQGSILHIHASQNQEYAWDGCSPKFMLLGLAVGTPDGAINPKTGKAITYYASMAHDILYQFRKDLKGFVTRKQADRVFLELLRRDGFQLAEVYYLAVRLFGLTYWPAF